MLARVVFSMRCRGLLTYLRLCEPKVRWWAFLAGWRVDLVLETTLTPFSPSAEIPTAFSLT